MTMLADAPPSVGFDTSGFYFPEPIVVQGTPVGDYYNALLRGLTHKLNNYLAVIQGFSSLILMSDGLPGGVRENLDHMKEATQGANQLGERILAAGGCARMNPQAIQLKDFLPLIEPNLRPVCNRLNVPLQINIAPEVPPILADNGRFKEILCELVTNAAEAVQMGGRSGAAAIDVLPPGRIAGGRPGHVDLFIRDTGPGIPPEKMKDVFRSFHSTKDSKHYGIGLTLVHMLSGQMGIRVGAKSDAGTTTFWLSIPVA